MQTENIQIPIYSTKINSNFENVINLILHLASEIENINITKLLKLLYLVDERAMIELGVRITWQNYSVWKNGPVLAELYNDLKYNKPEKLFQYIETKETKNGTIILPKKKAALGCFSISELNLINSVVNDYKNKSANWLVNFLHEKGTLWEKIVTEKQLNFNTTKTSNYTIDLESLIKNKPIQEMFYSVAIESIEYQKDFYRCVSA